MGKSDFLNVINDNLPDARVHPPDAHKGHPYISAGRSTRPRIARISVKDHLVIHASIPASMPVHIGQTLELGIRTDEIRVFPGDTSVRMAESINDPSRSMTLVAGTVMRILPKGVFHSITVLLKTGQTLDIPMVAREMHDLGIDVGSGVMVGVPARAVHAFWDRE